MDTEKIASLIKELRQRDNLSQNEFAKKYGVTYQAVSKWENGKNLPDVVLLKEICNDYNISLDYVLGNKKKSKLKYFIIFILVLLIILSIVLISFSSNNKINFKTLSSSCTDFNIYGTLVYNKGNSHLHLSNVTYCGGDDNTMYKEINCTLYEQKDDSIKVLDTCKYSINKSVSLEEYLKNIDFDLADFSKNCKSYDNSSLFIEIDAYSMDDKLTTYKIPLNINKSCNN